MDHEVKVKQIAANVNEALKAAIGDQAVLVNEDLSNLVEAGQALEDAGGYDAYGRSIANVIGRTTFVDRDYEDVAPSLRKDATRYGSIYRKIRADILEASDNADWELQAGQSYDPHVFTPATTHEKFFNKKTTYQVKISLTRMQIEASFHSAGECEAFNAMIENQIRNQFTIDTENLELRTLNNMIAETLYDEVPGGVYSGRSGNKAINLLYKYNQAKGQSLTADKCWTDPEFLRFAIREMQLVAKKMRSASRLYNIGKTFKFTPKSRQKFIIHNEFESSLYPYLYSYKDQFSENGLGLPDHDVVNYWQGVEDDFEPSATTSIYVTTTEGHTVQASGILGVLFDEEAACIWNEDKRVTSGYNPVGNFFNYWHKADASYLNDFDENFVVFYVA